MSFKYYVVRLAIHCKLLFLQIILKFNTLIKKYEIIIIKMYKCIYASQKLEI